MSASKDAPRPQFYSLEAQKSRKFSAQRKRRRSKSAKGSRRGSKSDEDIRAELEAHRVALESLKNTTQTLMVTVQNLVGMMSSLPQMLAKSEKTLTESATVLSASSPVRKWSNKEVCAWLSQSAGGLTAYTKVFEEHGVDGQDLGELETPQELVDLGVYPIHARKILRSLREIK